MGCNRLAERLCGAVRVFKGPRRQLVLRHSVPEHDTTSDTVMNSEPKSIYFSSQALDLDRTDPQRIPSSVSSSVVPSSPSILDNGIHWEIDLQVNQQQDIPTTGKQTEAHNSVGNNRQFVNATLQRVPEASNLEPPASFRKPDIPLQSVKSVPKAQNVLKHSRSEDNNGTGRVATKAERPPQKRPKLRPRHTLDPETFGSAFAANPFANKGSPPSPLFFSHSSRQRPILPPSFSSSEAAATMLNKARDEAGGVTTVKLARGSISTASPPRSTSIPGSWASLERNSVPRSPDARGKSSTGLQILASVGIIELLEQDERPTFIIDVANPVNFSPGGPLQIVFANASLRAYSTILEMVTGKPDLDSPSIVVTNDFPEFKAWALSFVKNNESLDICLPSFLYEGVTWTCSTLRKRLRLISGSGFPAAVASSSSNGAPSGSSVLSERPRGPAMNSSVGPSPLIQSTEPTDYFGDAANRVRSTASTSPQHLPSSPGLPSALSPPGQVMIVSQGESLTNELMNTSYPESSSFDWTRLPISAALPRHIQFARSVDWASTPLGPIESWGFDLRAMCNLIMGSPHPAAMYWGKRTLKSPHSLSRHFFGLRHIKYYPKRNVRDRVNS